MQSKDVLILISITVGLITILTTFARIFIITPMKSFIKEQTYPIQPTSNGGRSLRDVAETVARIEQRLNEHIDFHLKDK
jgi:hypothetical protein